MFGDTVIPPTFGSDSVSMEHRIPNALLQTALSRDMLWGNPEFMNYGNRTVSSRLTSLCELHQLVPNYQKTRFQWHLQDPSV